MIGSVQVVHPAAASVSELTKPNTANLGTQSRSAAAELEAIISARNGSTRALPTLMASPALLVRAQLWDFLQCTQQQLLTPIVMAADQGQSLTAACSIGTEGFRLKHMAVRLFSIDVGKTRSEHGKLPVARLSARCQQPRVIRSPAAAACCCRSMRPFSPSLWHS